jgi:hypothetical protein
MAGYSGTPLVKKLGIKEGHELALISAPNGFTDTLGTLPLPRSTSSSFLRRTVPR